VSASHASELRFLIKELGDFTTGLYQRVNQGDPLIVEGPYGRLDFDLNQPQIWVAGGVGIASFFAVLQALQMHRAHPAVHLFYCTRGIDSVLVDELWSLARKARVSLSVIDTQLAPRLNAQQIAAKCGDLRNYEFYFCGPEAFSKALKTELASYRVNVEQHYHQELFVMR
jgi:predicted ferric reductase